MPRKPRILDVIRHVLLLQHSSDLDEVISHKNANLSTSSMGCSSWRLLFTASSSASSAASAILNLSERRVDVVKSGSLCCANNLNNNKITQVKIENVKQTLKRTITLCLHRSACATFYATKLKNLKWPTDGHLVLT